MRDLEVSVVKRVENCATFRLRQTPQIRLIFTRNRRENGNKFIFRPGFESCGRWGRQTCLAAFSPDLLGRGVIG